MQLSYCVPTPVAATGANIMQCAGRRGGGSLKVPSAQAVDGWPDPARGCLATATKLSPRGGWTFRVRAPKTVFRRRLVPAAGSAQARRNCASGAVKRKTFVVCTPPALDAQHPDPRPYVASWQRRLRFQNAIPTVSSFTRKHCMKVPVLLCAASNVLVLLDGWFVGTQPGGIAMAGSTWLLSWPRMVSRSCSSAHSGCGTGRAEPAAITST